MIVNEFRIGSKVVSNWILEAGIMTLDGTSGRAVGDSRLGSTNYIISLGFGI